MTHRHGPSGECPGGEQPDDLLAITPVTEETFARRRHALARLSHLLVPPPDDKDNNEDKVAP
jgi:hypothetical protein